MEQPGLVRPAKGGLGYLELVMLADDFIILRKSWTNPNACSGLCCSAWRGNRLWFRLAN